MADLKNLTLQFKNPKTNETFKGYMKTSEDLVILADGTTLRDLKDALWNTIAMQAFQMLQHSNSPHLTTDDLSEIIAGVTYDDTTGTLSVTTCGGETTAIASNLNKSVSKFEKYVAAADDADFAEGHIVLKLELVNGDTYKVDLTDFVNDNIKVDGTTYTAAYTEQASVEDETNPDNLYKNIQMRFSSDHTSDIPAKVLSDGEVYEAVAPNKSGSQCSVNIKFYATPQIDGGDCTNLGAKLQLFEVGTDISKPAYVNTNDVICTSDGNTRPLFNAALTNLWIDKYYKVTTLLYNNSDCTGPVIYATPPAIIRFTDPVVSGD